MNNSRLREALRLGSNDPWADSVYWKSAPSAPPAPDYQGAANATAAGNKENLQYQTQANRYNQYTPYGNQTWTPGNPDTGAGWSSSVNLDPTAKATLDSQLAASKNMGDLTNRYSADVNNQGAFDSSSVQKIEDQSYANQTSRLDPQWKQNDEMQASKLANQGIVQGSEAYDNAMRTYGENKNDAYTQARQAAIATAPQTYQLAQSAYDQPLNRLNAIRTGAQIQNPQFQGTPGAGYTPGPDLLGAANGQNQYNMGLYNSGVGQANSFNSGLASLGGAAIMAFSDVRLKSNIKRIGTHPLGIGIYEYDIFDRREIGVMAQELWPVRPDAVSVHPSGFLQVDYGRLNA